MGVGPAVRRMLDLRSGAWLLAAFSVASCNAGSSRCAGEAASSTPQAHSSSNTMAIPPSNAPSSPPAPTATCPATGQFAMAACAHDDSKNADTDLTQLLDKVRSSHKGDVVFIKQFDAAQAAWSKFRDAELASIYAHADDPARPMAYGSSHSMCWFYTRAALTRHRIADLQPWVVGVEPGCGSEYPDTVSP